MPRTASQASRAAIGSVSGVLAVGDADDLAAGLGVGLGAAQVQQQAAGLGLEVGEGEGGQLGAAQRAGEAEQDDRGVADAADGGAVDGGDDLAQVGDAERPGRPARGGAEDAAQSAADLADRVVVDRVGDSRGGGAGARWPSRPTSMVASEAARSARSVR